MKRICFRLSTIKAISTAVETLVPDTRAGMCCREKLQERLAKLSGGVAVIKVRVRASASTSITRIHSSRSG